MIAFTKKTLAEQDFAITVYGGRMTDGSIGEVLTEKTSFLDTYVLVGALSWTFATFYENALSFELEGQVGKWFEGQNSWEFNIPVVIRWSKFPWSHYVSTSLAYGLGASYATEEPEAEIDRLGSSNKFLVYWHAEIAFGPSDSNWACVLRIHHRSGAFGIVADQGDGGSNTLGIGLKYRF